MRDRLRTLVLDSNGFAFRDIAADTLVLGLLRARNYEFVPRRLRDVRFIRLLKERYEALGYIADWREALRASPALDVRVCNIANLVDYVDCLRAIREYDLVIALHSAAGDSLTLLEKSVRWLRRRRGKLVVFVGNEYDLMAEKTRFLRRARADYVCSQLPIESARWLYADSGATVLAMPHALNPRVYRPGPAGRRPVDVGFAGAMYPLFIGDVERTRLIRAVEAEARGRGLACDIHEGTISRHDWARFLSDCEGTVGGESGTYYLDRRGSLVAAAKAFAAKHPTASFEEIHERFFADPGVAYVSGKCVSSRHFEAIGSKTCQVLLDGHYNGILEADVHYIAVRKDLADVENALTRFQDAGHRRELVERAYEYVLDGQTHAHRVRDLVTAVGG